MPRSYGNILTIVWTMCVAIAIAMFVKGFLNALRDLVRK